MHAFLGLPAFETSSHIYTEGPRSEMPIILLLPNFHAHAREFRYDNSKWILPQFSVHDPDPQFGSENEAPPYATLTITWLDSSLSDKKLLLALIRWVVVFKCD